MNFRNLGIWAAIVIALAGMYALMNPSQRTATVSELSYSQLLAKIDGGSVRSVEMAGPKIIVTDTAGKTFASTTPNNQEDLVKRLEARNVDIKVKPPGGMSAGAIFLQLLPIIIMVGIWIFFMRQMQGGARGAMGFGKSKAKMLTENRNRVTFEDVA
ncbi:MAG: ATP-dependent metallopeptidase FtsH/Yme1/Tma family protein, partial [Phenylobacterium sp.]|nr:ATP-dependent metallopeptidase FtsH/Yme1/Tma family protein [Phenylobacterium sp.]